MVLRRGLTVVVAFVLVLALPAAASAAKGAKPGVRQISKLFVLNAGLGALQPVRGHKRVFTLTLTHLERHVVWFSDRPARTSGTLPSSSFSVGWKGLGFTSNPPNAALVYGDPDGDGSTVILELRRPRYNAHAKSITFTARWIDPKSVRSGNLAAHAKKADPAPDRRFSDATLFIDASTAQVINNCTIQPGTQCLYAQLANANLANADLNNSDMDLSDLSFTNLTDANLSNTSLYGASFILDNLTGANLTEASLDSASFTQAILNGANLTGASLTGAILTQANLTGANLTGANLTSAILRQTVFCHTTMPDGSINNSGC